MTTRADDPAARARARLRRASWIAGGMGMFALHGAAWVAFTVSPKLESPPLPRPNGFDDALRASVAIEQSRFPDSRALDVSTADAASLRPWVEANKEAVATLRRAIRQPFQCPVTYELTAMNDQATQQAPLRTSGARALYAEGRLARLEGREGEAAEAFLDLIRLGDAMGRNVPMMGFLASKAPITLGLHGLREIRESLGPAELARVVAALEELDAQGAPHSETIRLEQAFMEQHVRTQLGVAGVVYRLVGNLQREKAALARTITYQSQTQIAARRLLLADLALRLHRRNTGADPASLEALVPAILKAVPVDPFTGKPLLYRSTAEGAQVYAAGPDGDDDQLATRLGRKMQPTSNGDYTVDSF